MFLYRYEKIKYRYIDIIGIALMGSVDGGSDSCMVFVKTKIMVSYPYSFPQGFSSVRVWLVPNRSAHSAALPSLVGQRVLFASVGRGGGGPWGSSGVLGGSGGSVGAFGVLVGALGG